MNGLLIVDKSAGMTSNDVVRRVRRLLGMRRVGHCGTLDPLATGVLPVVLGEGTRLVEFIMEGDKGYHATLRLGETTDTQDATGTLLEQRDCSNVTETMVRAAAETLVGEQAQLPPMYSALKRNGVPLYRLARQGLEVERTPRLVRIARLDVPSVRLPLVDIEVDCSKGTYIRTLVHDFGQRLGVGAHLTALRRVRHGRFDLTQAITLEQLAERLQGARPLPLLGLHEVLNDWPQMSLTDEGVRRLSYGIPPALADLLMVPACAPGTLVTLCHGGRLWALGRFAPLREQERRGDFELLRVFLPQPGGE